MEIKTSGGKKTPCKIRCAKYVKVNVTKRETSRVSEEGEERREGERRRRRRGRLKVGQGGIHD